MNPHPLFLSSALDALVFRGDMYPVETGRMCKTNARCNTHDMTFLHAPRGLTRRNEKLIRAMRAHFYAPRVHSCGTIPHRISRESIAVAA